MTCRSSYQLEHCANDLHELIDRLNLGVVDLLGFDGAEADLGVIAATVFDMATGDVDEDLASQVQGFGGAVLIVSSVRLDPRWRGFGLGPVLVGEAIEVLSQVARLVACYPSPIGESDDDRLAGPARDAAVTKLEKVWSALGFWHYRDGVWVIDLAPQTLGDNLRTLRQAFKTPTTSLDAAGTR
ncbi:hypothetical protein Lfu02_00310 [Longispora fulva]|uniref:GNAT superfamily N-acetyltransferase n=1 Tax=Longispora fulva TaxID=619741 RepID=A0A8J7GS98_9ACTN|nr:hypothetical protein [Longispora fulva]MBG6136096.1 GNAT superfamily N-acetyltransferase [Longispora fulva]GIG55659.1 hypothetical protein Lfu02_00310 [Longispora fulva]